MNVSFESGSVLWGFEQSLYEKLVRATRESPLLPDEIARLEGNLWVPIAARVAPENMVIRQWVLLDVIHGAVDHYDAIINQMIRLTYRGTGDGPLLWAEGYSYWSQDVKPFLILYASMLPQSFSGFISRIDLGFQQTSYLRSGRMYPAPFGDLYDIPLEDSLQFPSLMSARANITPVTKAGGNYGIAGLPVGLNTHVPKEDAAVTIVDGIPTPFTFYSDDGTVAAYYAKYYVNGKFSPWNQWRDILDWRRIRSI